MAEDLAQRFCLGHRVARGWRWVMELLWWEVLLLLMLRLRSHGAASCHAFACHEAEGLRAYGPFHALALALAFGHHARSWDAVALMLEAHEWLSRSWDVSFAAVALMQEAHRCKRSRSWDVSFALASLAAWEREALGHRKLRA